MKVYNPTGWGIEFMACKKIYQMDPFSIIEIGESQHVRVIFGPRHHASYDLGVVSIDYKESDARHHDSYEKFVLAQTKAGLEKAKRYRHEAWLNERQAEVDIRHSSASSESDKEIVNPKKFKEKLDQVEGWLKDLEEGVHPACKMATRDPNKISLSDISEEDRLVIEQEIRASLESNVDTAPKRRGRPPVKKEPLSGQTGNQGASAA